jgi:hypothetical protein
MIDHSLDDPIDSDDEDYIMRKIREEYLSNSTVLDTESKRIMRMAGQ